jgi:RNA polymerase sigma-70 factor (ECF subfamily)
MRSDAELVTATLAGRREAFADLVRRYEVAVRSAALAVVANEHTAQDVAQDAFVAAYVNLRTLKKPAAFGGWLIQIARRQALTALERKRDTQPLETVDPPDVPHRNGQIDEASRDLLAAVDRLPEQERIVVMLNYFSGQPVSAVAQMTGRPIGTVTGQLTRARARLRTWLKAVEP